MVTMALDMPYNTCLKRLKLTQRTCIFWSLKCVQGYLNAHLKQFCFLLILKNTSNNYKRKKERERESLNIILLIPRNSRNRRGITKDFCLFPTPICANTNDKMYCRLLLQWHFWKALCLSLCRNETGTYVIWQ